MNRWSSTLFAILLLAAGCSGGRQEAPEAPAAPTTLRVGHFPNITHAQALVAHQLSRQGKGWFEERLGPGMKIEWFVYNAGPSAMEAIFTSAIDLTYVGPSPAINAYFKSRGDEVRIIAGAARGGSALVVHKDSRLRQAGDFRGRKIATPQLGNTQDVACRFWLVSNGLKVTQLGGEAQIIPTANADQLQVFQAGQVDAVWTVEPWVSRLELEADGEILIDEHDTITTVLVSRKAFMKEQIDLVRRFAAAHAELTGWIAQHPAEAQELVAQELKELTSRPISPELLQRAWGRITLDSRISSEPLTQFVKSARAVGFLQEDQDLSKLVAEIAP